MLLFFSFVIQYNFQSEKRNLTPEKAPIKLNHPKHKQSLVKYHSDEAHHILLVGWLTSTELYCVQAMQKV